MNNAAINRRGFLKHGSAAVGGMALLANRAAGANERLSIGMIGIGDRASGLLTQIIGLAKKHNVEVSAVCDVWQPNLNRAADRVEKAFGKKPRTCTRFRDLLALKDVDAVVIATPDFTHCPMLIEALKAGKDAYIEKPMSLDIGQANQALDLARASNRVVQAGTQFRSHGGYTAVERELAKGVIGSVNRIHAQANFNHARWARPFADCCQADVDWEAFLFNLPKRPFEAKLVRRWHLYKEFTNGLSGLWMSHYVDAVHKMTGATYPASAVAHGGIYVWKDGREHTDTFHALLEYPASSEGQGGGFLFDWGMSLCNAGGTLFTVHGTRGTLNLGKNYISPTELTVTPEGKGSASFPIKPEPTPDHMGNWLECLRSRQRPNADIQYGHQHAVATIMAATALETGRRQKYDSKKREMYAG